MAAVFEIGGCFAFWTWLRSGGTVWWIVPGLACLAVFAMLLARVEAPAAGRTFAAYGGIYIAASLGWLWAVEGVRPDRFDTGGAMVALIGSLLILFGPR